MDQDLQKLLLDEFVRKDHLVLELSDSLDVKANITLVLITFLSTETAYFLDKAPSGIIRGLEITSAISLAIALCAAIVGLWPRNYSHLEPESTNSRINELEAFFSESQSNPIAIDEFTSSELNKDRMNWCRDRIRRNQKNNLTKADCLNVAFYSTAAAMALNLGVMVELAASLK